MKEHRPLGHRQRAVLVRMLTDDLRWMTGLYPYAIWSGDRTNVANQVVFSLEDRGLVARWDEGDLRRSRWYVRLTEEGRRVAEELRDEEQA